PQLPKLEEMHGGRMKTTSARHATIASALILLALPRAPTSVEVASGAAPELLASSVKSVTSRLNHTCVLTVAGFARCWGANEAGQLGVSMDAFACNHQSRGGIRTTLA